MRIGSFMAIVAGAITGCSDTSYLRNYEGIAQQSVVTEKGRFLVFDKPAEGKMLLALGGIVGPQPKPIYRQAVEKFLSEAGRTCTLIDGYQIVSVTWEFAYACADAPAVTRTTPPKVASK